MNIHYWKLLAKYITGEASEKEVEALEAWVKSDPAHRELLNDAAQAWETTKESDAVRTDVAAAWDTLEGRIEKEEAGSKSPSHATRRRPPRRNSRSMRRRVLRAAGGVAMVLMIVFVALLWEEGNNKVIYAERGERSTVELVDGTRVHLNAESKLTLLAISGRGAREVQLEGEAYFDVAHDKNRPFLVRTSEGTIRVVGTAFNVRAYSDEKGAEVAVTEGAVALHVKESTQATLKEAVVLRPRQLGVMADRHIRALRRDIDLAPHVAWREGRLVFDDAPFPEVIRRLERWYDLQIETHQQFESIDRLNAIFDRESASEVISDIAMALGLQYEQDGGRVTFYRRMPDSTSATEKASSEK